jgi:hypothetical protein
MKILADLNERAVVDSNLLEWVSSPTKVSICEKHSNCRREFGEECSKEMEKRLPGQLLS